MGNKRNKDNSIEKLEKEIRELKSLNRSLMRRLKKYDRHYKDIDVDEEDEPTDNVDKFYKTPRQVNTTCPECSQNELETIKVMNRTFQKCGNCGWRSKAEKT